MSDTPHGDIDSRPVWARSAERRAAQRREPSFKRLILNLIVLALVVAGVCFVVAPVTAFFAIRAAAEASDVQGLTRLIDYDAVRASMRPQISGRVEPMTPPPSFIQDPVGAVRRQFQQSVTPRAPDAPEVDTYLTPRAIMGLTKGAGRAAPTATVVEAPWPRLRYWGVNRARLAVRDQAGVATLFTFERRGPFEWKLVQVGLPADSASNG